MINQNNVYIVAWAVVYLATMTAQLMTGNVHWEPMIYATLPLWTVIASVVTVKQLMLVKTNPGKWYPALMFAGTVVVSNAITYGVTYGVIALVGATAVGVFYAANAIVALTVAALTPVVIRHWNVIRKFFVRAFNRA